MAMPRVASKNAIEFIVEFADRFDDLSDYEVLLAYAEYTRSSVVPEFESILARVILHAYNHKDLQLTIDYARMVYGVEVSG